MPGARLIQCIQEVASRAGVDAVAVSFYDYESTKAFSFQADRPFHAASTIKAALLLAVFKAADEGRLNLGSRLHVRNRFRSVIDGAIFRVSPNGDGDAETHKRRGRAAPIIDLARVMIVRSSNLATNVLFDFLGGEYVRRVIEEAEIEGIDFQRGVEDLSAFEKGVNNGITAHGLLRLFRIFCDRRFLSESSCDQAIEILLAQEFNGMIPSRLPTEAKVAHKTGEISTACHDAGIVFIPERKPLVLAILTEGPADHGNRPKAVADLSGAIFEAIGCPRKI